MGASVSRRDFEWVADDEPHATRRKLILAKYPQIKSLMKVDPWFKWKTLAIVVFQILFLILLHRSNSWLLYAFCCYFVTGTFNHSLMLAVHEISHGQAFGQNRVAANRWFGMIANLPIGVPMSVSFKKYHLEHHRYQGHDVIDTDIPSEFETRFFTTTALKVLWVILQPFFYTLRPFFTHPKPPTVHEFTNLVVQLTFDCIIGFTLGWHMVAYLIMSTLVTMGLHPVAGHFISEHYIMFTKEDAERFMKTDKLKEGVNYTDGRLLIPETCSYYGPLNLLTFNVGYHVEHHDFPSIPGSKLPLLRKIAPEYYENLCHHTSWVKVIWKYITDPGLGPCSRVKRANKISAQHDDNDNLCDQPTVNGTTHVKAY